MTGQPPIGDQRPGTARSSPPRPVLVEIAAALVIVGGAFNLLLSVDAMVTLARQGGDIGLLPVVTIVLAMTVLALGLLVRSGRAWLVALNVVAVLAFLELISQTPVGLVFGMLDVVVVLALIRERPWFEAKSAERRSG